MNNSPTVPSQYTFALEPLSADLFDETMPLLVAHWEEIAHFKDIPLVPDRNAYALRRLGELGLLSSVDLPTVERVVGEARGAPVRVGTLPDAH